MSATGTLGPAAVPAVAAVTALGYLLAATGLRGLLGPVVVVAVAAGCATVLVRRRTRGLVSVLAGISVWLAASLLATRLLGDRPLAGFVLVVTAFFLVALPAIPWLYAATFSAAHGPRPTAHAPRTERP
jgi:hypothetical protein